MHPLTTLALARARLAELREAARVDRCCGRGAIRRQQRECCSQ
jgi:hypothetical protein